MVLRRHSLWYSCTAPYGLPNMSIPVQEILHITPEKLPGYEEKLKTFYLEHIHTDEEIRYMLDGSGAPQVVRCVMG